MPERLHGIERRRGDSAHPWGRCRRPNSPPANRALESCASPAWASTGCHVPCACDHRTTSPGPSRRPLTAFVERAQSRPPRRDAPDVRVQSDTPIGRENQPPHWGCQYARKFPTSRDAVWQGNARPPHPGSNGPAAGCRSARGRQEKVRRACGAVSAARWSWSIRVRALRGAGARVTLSSSAPRSASPNREGGSPDTTWHDPVSSGGDSASTMHRAASSSTHACSIKAHAARNPMRRARRVQRSPAACCAHACLESRRREDASPIGYLGGGETDRVHQACSASLRRRA